MDLKPLPFFQESFPDALQNIDLPLFRLRHYQAEPIPALHGKYFLSSEKTGCPPLLLFLHWLKMRYWEV